MTKSVNQKTLFQKLGNKWYAFTLINDEPMYTAIPEGVNPVFSTIELYTDELETSTSENNSKKDFKKAA